MRVLRAQRLLLQPMHNAHRIRWSSTLGKINNDLDEKPAKFSTTSMRPAMTEDMEPEVQWSGSTPCLKARTVKELSDAELAKRVVSGKSKFFNLENELNDKVRAVKVRRSATEKMAGRPDAINSLPYEHYDYDKIFGQCCENVIGHLPIPVGVAGPLVVDGSSYMVPMATTEGALVASTARGCKALSAAGGVTTAITRDGMSRAPVVQCRDVREAQKLAEFCEAGESYGLLEKTFNATSRFARLQSIRVHLAGRMAYLRFTSSTGDAMGMNMVGKATEAALGVVTQAFPDLQILALSGNVCTDKKSAAINWVQGRGKSVSVDCVVPGAVVRDVLKTTVAGLCKLNYSKNLVGSAIAGALGGFNAHAANVVTAVFLATGQDPAQNVESSSCITLMEPTNDGEDLYCAVTMPSIEVGTVGGGTSLPAQGAMLSLLGCQGASRPGSDTEEAEDKAGQLARIVASTVLAGELSLLSALSSGDLISSHLKLNRK